MATNSDQTYQALIERIADRIERSRWLRQSDIDLDAGALHPVLLEYPDLAGEALASPHFITAITDELNSSLSQESEDARLAEHVRTYLRNACELRVFDDVRSLLWQREEREETGSFAPFAHPSRVSA